MNIRIATSSGDSPRRSFLSYTLATLLFLFLVVSAIHLAKPLFDNDFYWHLKTGYWMWEHQAFPSLDPFTFPPQPDDLHRTRFMLTSYWLFQLLLCAFHKAAGNGGIIFFRLLLVVAFGAIFYRFSEKKKLVTALAAGIGLTQILSEFFPERPQFISFICCALLLSTIFTHLNGKKQQLMPLLVPLSLTMLLWANSHGGFLLGNILLLLILLAEGVKFVHPKLEPISGKEYLHLTLAITAAIAISVVNPNHIFSFEMVRSYAEASSIIHTSTLENSHLYEYYTLMGGYQPAITVCTYLAILIIFLRSRERTNITWIGLLLLLGYMGLQHVRYHPFFLIVAILFAIRYYDTSVLGKKTLATLLIFFIVVVSLSLYRTPQNFKLIGRYGLVPAAYFPVKVCDYLIDHPIEGNVFTTIDWGGYVLWRIAPHNKLFIDGRHMDPSRSWQYFFHENDWQPLYDKYNIRILILPTYDEPNKPNAVAAKLARDPRWRLVSQGNNGSLFVRN